MLSWLKKKKVNQEDVQAQTQETAESEQDDRKKGFGGEIVIEAREWYKDKFRQSVNLSVILALVMTFSLIVNLVQAVTSPKPQYYAVTGDMRVMELQPLNEPFVTQDGLFNWTTRTITETFSFDFVHWRDQLMGVRSNYTDKAFEELVGSLQSSGNLEMVRERRLVLSATVERSPVITAKGDIKGRMAWKMEFPIKLTYESSEGVVASKDLMCQILVHRVQVTEHPRGIKIAQVILR